MVHFYSDFFILPIRVLGILSYVSSECKTQKSPYPDQLSEDLQTSLILSSTLLLTHLQFFHIRVCLIDYSVERVIFHIIQFYFRPFGKCQIEIGPDIFIIVMFGQE